SCPALGHDGRCVPWACAHGVLMAARASVAGGRPAGRGAVRGQRPSALRGVSPCPRRAAYVAVTVLLAASVALRRRYPVAAFTVAAAVAAVQAAFGVRPGAPTHVFALQPNNADLAIVVLLYTLAAHRPRRVSVAGLAICLAGSAVAIARRAPSHGAYA